MKKSSPVRIKEIWLIMFLLGMIMINYPFVHIFNKDVLIFGYPLTFLYFMLGWPASILVVYLFARHAPDDYEDDGDDQEKGSS